MARAGGFVGRWDVAGAGRPARRGVAQAGTSAHRGGLAGRDWPLAVGIGVGLLVDGLVGDPRRGHPVAAFGRAASWLERRAYADDRLRGSAYAGACVLGATLPAMAAHRLTRDRPLWRTVAVAAMAWAVTGARSLRHESEQIVEALDAGNLPGARAALPGLCGRDPDRLDAKGLTRAVVESVAENTSDAAVAPLLWAAVAGLPGMAAYRAVNTLDAMVGYRSARYGRFGWASARLDDVANWAPARLTAALTVACAPVAGGSPKAAWRAVSRYGGRHPSPNAGRPEAAFAGALGLRLGGANSYEGVTEHRAELGDGRPPEPADIRRAQRLSLAVTVTAAVLAAALPLARRRLRGPRLTEPHLSGPRLAGPRLAGPRLAGPGLRGPRLTEPHVRGPRLRGPHVTEPHLGGPRLGGPRLTGPRLTGPRLVGPGLRGPRLTEPRLGGPRLGGRLAVNPRGRR